MRSHPSTTEIIACANPDPCQTIQAARLSRGSLQVAELYNFVDPVQPVTLRLRIHRTTRPAIRAVGSADPILTSEPGPCGRYQSAFLPFVLTRGGQVTRGGPTHG
jgi:hypothetical protein